VVGIRKRLEKIRKNVDRKRLEKCQCPIKNLSYQKAATPGLT